MPSLLQTPLHDWHIAHGGRMVDFAGWSMPVQYTSIVEEHLATRNAVTVFDISHMGRLRFEGPDAAKWLDGLVTRRVLTMKSGWVRYGLVTNERGGILDDVLVYRLPQASGADRFSLVVNGSNREKIVEWLETHQGGNQATLHDETRATAMIAVQGPAAVAAAQTLLPDSLRLAELKYYTGAITTVAEHPALVSRTGYTGEDGCELSVPAEVAVQVWQHLIDQGASPAGLGARDTLRLEAAMPLYGHELSEDIDPFQAGLGFAVQFKDHPFVGHETLAAQAAAPAVYQRVGLQLAGKRVPRDGYAVLDNGAQVGHVTSGTFSPTLGSPIAMAYLAVSAATEGATVSIDIRGREVPATIVPLPFYSRRS